MAPAHAKLLYELHIYALTASSVQSIMDRVAKRFMRG
jgi:hypothetical protein